jgi:rRNA pseudouridine-1189 N-methylase Emg1 (Nep1/Mra1 family)
LRGERKKKEKKERKDTKTYVFAGIFEAGDENNSVQKKTNKKHTSSKSAVSNSPFFFLSARF